MLNDLFRVVVVTSRRAPGLDYLLDADPERGRTYQIVSAVTSDWECQEIPRLVQAGVPFEVQDIRAFYRERGMRWTDLSHRAMYDEVLAHRLSAYQPDLVILCGYLHVVTAPVLERFAPALINLHDSDLGITDASGRPRFRGLHAVRDAIFAGQHVTRSTVHVVTPEVDFGPRLLMSQAFPTHPMLDEARAWKAQDILKAYAYAHREWMMRASWGRLLATAIALYGDGDIELLGHRALVCGLPGPLTVGRSGLERPSAVAHAL